MQRCSEIVSQLRDEIQSGWLPVGALLRQDALATRFGTSRMPVREALRLLAEEGLVRQEHYRGAMVVGIDAKLKRDWFEVRKVLQCRALRAAVPTLKPSDIESIVTLFERLRVAAYRLGDSAESRQIEVALQLALVSVQPNRVVASILHDAIRSTTLAPSLLQGMPLLVLGSVVEHCRLRRRSEAVSALRKYLLLIGELGARDAAVVSS